MVPNKAQHTGATYTTQDRALHTGITNMGAKTQLQVL